MYGSFKIKHRDFQPLIHNDHRLRKQLLTDEQFADLHAPILGSNLFTNPGHQTAGI